MEGNALARYFSAVFIYKLYLYKITEGELSILLFNVTVNFFLFLLRVNIIELHLQTSLTQNSVLQNTIVYLHRVTSIASPIFQFPGLGKALLH